MSSTFTPFYATSDLQALFRNYQSGGLDGIHSRNHVMLGIVGCDRPARGLRAESLLERYSSSDVHRAFQSMARDAEPYPTLAAILYVKYCGDVAIEDIARAMDMDDASHAQGVLIEAQDEYMRRLMNYPTA
jgi:hypothetical protein